MIERFMIFAQGLLGPADDLGIPDNDLSSSTALNPLFNLAYVVAAVVAIIVIIIAGLNYASSRGDTAKITKAKNMIIYAVSGLIIVFIAFVLTNMVIGEMP